MQKRWHNEPSEKLSKEQKPNPGPRIIRPIKNPPHGEFFAPASFFSILSLYPFYVKI